MTLPSSEFLGAVRDAPTRIDALTAEFRATFHKNPTIAVSAPGRTEVVGNHTDHNHGCVVTAAVELDSLAVIAPRDDGVVHLHSRGWSQPFVVDCGVLEPDAKDDTTASLVRGVAAGLSRLGIKPRAFSGTMESAVLPGSGLSSSASVEMLLVESFLAVADGHDELSVVQMAQIGQFAENEFMGKPSGLMDQLGCAHGGAVAVDFGSDPPVVDALSLSLADRGYRLAVVETGGDHADLTPDYASVPYEMKAVAESLGATTLSSVAPETLFADLAELREKHGDRTVLRAMHFFDETKRARDFVQAARGGDIAQVLAIMNESGSSSWRMLQNVHVDRDPKTQPMAVALALTEQFLRNRGAQGASRVHGGGFAGTILIVIPKDLFEDYVAWMEQTLSTGCVHEIPIRARGVISAALM